MISDGKAEIPWEIGWHATLKEIDGKGRARYWSGHRVAATGPGQYVLSIEGVKGYEPIADRKVTIRHAEWTNVEIQLVRIR